MERAFAAPAADDAAAVTDIVVALESAFYGPSTYSQADLEEEWLDLDVERDALVVRDGDDIVGYCALRAAGDVIQAEGYVHPDSHGRGVGTAIATRLEEEASRRGGLRIHNRVMEADSDARALLESLGYRAVRVFREMRIELGAAPAAARWPDGLQAGPFDPERDAPAFHAAHQEAFADHWEYAPRDLDAWSTWYLGSDRFDPTLWCVVRSATEIVAGTICTGDTYGGGFVHVLFTRRPWRGRGVGAALLADAFGRFWERGEHRVGLGVDAASETGAFRLYERAGMSPALGWVIYEKHLHRAASDSGHQADASSRSSSSS